MDDFFVHENHAWPPSLATNCIMHHTNKSDLMECLESLVPQLESAPNVDGKIVDGAALVHTLDPKKSKVPVNTFQDYSQLVFLPYLEHMLQDVGRLDVVWDVYKEDSQRHKHDRTVELVTISGLPTTLTFLVTGITSFIVIQPKRVCSNI